MPSTANSQQCPSNPSHSTPSDPLPIRDLYDPSLSSLPQQALLPLHHLQQQASHFPMQEQPHHQKKP
ncbi:hypothetical protein Scep_015078 [Stephania cephalantha]|uniref:Uncharacterized protein n=1 Tax=Stephania cephalantha TaxID=152367 RepID=A0AAP0P024_9MAGN